MSYQLNEKLSGLTPYEVDTRTYAVKLDANESFIPLPDDICREVQDAVSRVNFNRYPDPRADKLCKAFANYYGIDPETVTAGNGSDELLYIISTCFTMAGDTIVTTDPDFSMYRFYGYLAECRSVVYNKSELEIDADSLIALCRKSDAKLLFFSNPCNPGGRGLCRADVLKIIREVDALVVVDEAYMDFWDQSVIDVAAEFENVILLRTLSKAVGAAAVRLGFAVANPTLSNALRAAKSPYNVNALSAAAGEVLLAHADYLKACKARIIASRDRLYAAFLPVCEVRGWRMKRPFTNFLLIETPEASEIYEFLKQKGILVRCFGGSLRITTGSEAENAALLAAVQVYIK